jgi:hypothetical protein
MLTRKAPTEAVRPGDLELPPTVPIDITAYLGASPW